MQAILKKNIENNSFELTIDTKIFDKEIIMKAAFNFLDLWYFLFAYDSDSNIVLQFFPKPWVEKNPEEIILSFTDDLLEVALRVALEKDNKIIRETIVTKSLLGPIDEKNFTTFDSDNQVNNQIDFDKDIDDILKEIENDPDLKIDEAEIERILKEIEAESEIQKPTISVDINAVQDIKLKFKK